MSHTQRTDAALSPGHRSANLCPTEPQSLSCWTATREQTRPGTSLAQIVEGVGCACNRAQRNLQRTRAHTARWEEMLISSFREAARPRPRSQTGSMSKRCGAEPIRAIRCAMHVTASARRTSSDEPRAHSLNRSMRLRLTIRRAPRALQASISRRHPTSPPKLTTRWSTPSSTKLLALTTGLAHARHAET